jgi:D-beta-D-heptose 7-phosphate kinase/D-beta-D-heptose 1-phosphate adenosyltransferase
MKHIIKQFTGKKIIVIGDLMLDEYFIGDIKGKSPEAPALLVRQTSKKEVPGGAGNAAMNLASLGAKVFILGRVGFDVGGSILCNLLKSSKINTEGIIKDGLPTIIKTRVICEKQQILRYDIEETAPLKDYERMLTFVKKRIRDIDGILISDYNKGVCQKDFMREIISLCSKSKKPIVVDSKSKDFMKYQGIDLFTPNLHDASMMTYDKIKRPGDIAGTLSDLLQSSVLMTMGDRGMLLYNQKPIIIPVKPIEKCDATGAGDTVSAVAILSLASGATLLETANISQAAARIVVQKPGTATVTQEELL